MKNRLPPNLQRKKIASSILFFLFLVFSAIALIIPKGTPSDYADTLYRRGLDTVFAFDVSRSMDLQDVPVNSQANVSRLEQGLNIARQVIQSAPGGRTAASIGRGKGYLSVPLTHGTEAVLNFINTLDNQSLMGGRSTNLQSLIETSSSAFQTTSPARRVIVLFSDGESHFGILKNALNYCVKEGIMIAAVAVGSDEGSLVPNVLAPDAFDPGTEPENNGAVSKRDIQSMRMAAERTGGIYIDGNRNDAASILTSYLRAQSKPGVGSADSEKFIKARYINGARTLFVILAIIAYGAHKFVLRSRRQKEKQDRRKNSRSLLISLLIAHCSLLIACTEGKLLLLEGNYLFSRGRYDEAAAAYHKALEHKDAAPYADYGLGTAYMIMDEGEAALRRYNNSREKLESFSDTTEHRELHYRLHYNSGIIFFEEGDFDSAAASFREALKAYPLKVDAKRNLEISLMSIQRETSQEKQKDDSYEETKDMMFEMVRQQEEQFWQSGEWTEERFSGPDY